MNGDSQAFPIPATDSFGQVWGLTKRELFAAMAMQGMAASKHWGANFSNNPKYLDDAMTAAVQAADALIAELSKAQP